MAVQGQFHHLTEDVALESEAVTECIALETSRQEMPFSVGSSITLSHYLASNSSRVRVIRTRSLLETFLSPFYDTVSSFRAASSCSQGQGRKQELKLPLSCLADANSFCFKLRTPVPGVQGCRDSSPTFLGWGRGGSLKCSAAVVTLCPRSVLLMDFIIVSNNGLERAVCEGLKAPVGFGYCGAYGLLRSFPITTMPPLPSHTGMMISPMLFLGKNSLPQSHPNLLRPYLTIGPQYPVVPEADRVDQLQVLSVMEQFKIYVFGETIVSIWGDPSQGSTFCRLRWQGWLRGSAAALAIPPTPYQDHWSHVCDGGWACEANLTVWLPEPGASEAPEDGRALMNAEHRLQGCGTV
ncbi:hypothetical protein EK904_011755 [Melospiza melodia maxima]|nr:hypothetical protein EK904_011755 [Melospiza melodia maxima]